MSDPAEKYLCLEDSCKGKSAMRWINFLKHQRVAHHMQCTMHLESFRSTIDFQVWFKFVQERFLRLPTVKQIGNSIHATCNRASSTACPARLYANRIIMNGDQVCIVALYMGEHYGHEHTAGREERLFLIDYAELALSPLEQWLENFRHAGVFILALTTPRLREMGQQLALQSIPLVVVGFMNDQQLRFLETFQWTICLQNHGNWIVMYSLAAHADDHSKPPLAIPVAYCYSNCINYTVVREFFFKIRCRAGLLNCILIVSNNLELFEYPWEEAFPETNTVFVQSWQHLVDKIIQLPNQVNYCEAKEIEDILRTAISKKNPYVENIADEFLMAAQLSQKLNSNTIINLSKKKHQIRIRDLLHKWIEELFTVGWTKSLDHMFWSENYYINRAIMNDCLPKVMMHLTLHFRHVLNNSPPMEKLEDLYCIMRVITE